ncbi:MAG TPA: P63C domain-containing protein [Polyangiaceae bacterium]|jgi:hypothetical protein|nr:P63C domain-containing protein [Polyangiaceae bacterium]
MSEDDKDEKNKHAAALSKLGASKGGRARAEVLAASERKSIARAAAAARWKKEVSDFKEQEKAAPASNGGSIAVDAMPYSMFQGDLEIGEVKMACHVLNDGRRVLAQREMVNVLSPGRDSGNLQAYIDSIPGDFKALNLGANFVKFRVPQTQFLSHGYQATFLIDICSAYLDARESRLLKRSQLGLARRAEVVMRACAKVGIEALVDEATGYDKFKKKREYQLKLQAFIAEDMQEWVKTFPDDFWIELARLEGIHYSPRHRPIRWGKYVMAFVYDAIDKDVGRKLRQINPSPERGSNHHQWLAAYGKDRIQMQLGADIAIMKLCKNMDEFRAKFAHVFKRQGLQLDFSFGL